VNFVDLLQAGGCGVSVRPKNARFNFAWLAIPPRGHRFTNGAHSVQRELDQEWADVIGFLDIEPCDPGCTLCAEFEDRHRESDRMRGAVRDE
jgi:hypothetical protein